MKDTIRLSDHGHTRMVAHRGVSGLETENTAAAFIAAGNRSYYGIETDIWRTADGKYICNHDGKSGRICKTDLAMEENSLSALRALRLNDRNTGRPDRGDLMLCTPEEYRSICAHYGKVCVPELKSRFSRREIGEILGIFDGYLDRTCFISFDLDNLRLIRSLRPDQKVQYLSGSYSPGLLTTLIREKMDLDIGRPALTEEILHTLHRSGITVNCWTVDDPADAETLIGWGVDQITSNILE